MGGNSHFSRLLGILDEVLRALPETRKRSNTVYSTRDGGLAAFAVFFMQSPSLLAHQQLMQRRRGFNNARTVFRIERIPTDNRIRGLLDGVAPSALQPAFQQAVNHGAEQGMLEGFRTRAAHLLCAIDGTGYFRSTAVHCAHCSHTERAEGKTEYSHMVVAAAIVAPDRAQVVPLMPEFVRQSEGASVQDCELVAGRRWIAAHGSSYGALGLTIVADDKYAGQPTCALIPQQ